MLPSGHTVKVGTATSAMMMTTMTIKYNLDMCDSANVDLYSKCDLVKYKLDQLRYGEQCDRIGRFIELLATFQSLWQQLYCPNH